MKLAGILMAWAVLTGVIVHCVMADHGVMFQNPMAALSLGMIGLGLCMESHKQLAAVKVQA